jgi:hypothetical protein
MKLLPQCKEVRKTVKPAVRAVPDCGRLPPSRESGPGEKRLDGTGKAHTMRINQTEWAAMIARRVSIGSAGRGSRPAACI